MKAQKAKMKGNEGPKGQNGMEMKAQKQILEKEKLQNLIGKWEFWARSWRDGFFGRFTRPK